MLRSPQRAKAGVAGMLLAAVLVAEACTAGGPGQAAPSSRLSGRQTLTYPIQSDFTTLDPAVIDTPSDAAIAHNLFDGLVRYDDAMQVVPDLAAALPAISADGLTYTFRLRPDATFSNGDAVTAKDVLYSWNRAAALQGSNAVNLSDIVGYGVVSNNQLSGAPLEALLEKNDASVTMSGLTAPDDRTVVVKLSSPAGWFLHAIAEPGVVGMVVDETVVKANFDGWWSSPATLVGTGPYRMTAHAAGSSIDFAAVPRWWGVPKPTLSLVHLQVQPDAAAAAASYRAGRYDLFGYGGYGPDVGDVVDFQEAPQAFGTVRLQPKNGSFWVSFNLVADRARTGGPFTLAAGQPARNLRLAFALAVDKAALVRQVCQDVLCLAATGGVIPKGLTGYLGDGGDPLAGYDPARARSLLLAADPNGTKTRGLVYSYDPENPLNGPAAQFLQKEWQDNLGVAVALQPVARTDFIKLRLHGRFVLSRDGWAADYDDPQDWFDNLWGKAAGCPDATCTSGYDTPAYDALLARADQEPAASAAADYAALSRSLSADAAYVPLYYMAGAYLIRSYVTGAGGNNLFDYPWSEIAIQSH